MTCPRQAASNGFPDAQKILSELHITIGQYIRAKGGSCEIRPAPFAVMLFADAPTIAAPDISVICDPRKLTDKECAGAPDWVIEIASPGNPGHDYIRKLNLYADSGVREYWIVDPMNRSLYVYLLEKERFKTMACTLEDRVKVNIYDDLWIDFSELSL